MKKVLTVGRDEKKLIEKFLKHIPLFRSFSAGNLKCMAEDFKVIDVKKGDDVVFRDDEGTDLYIVLKGKLKVRLIGLDGDEFILTSLKEGDFFGEMSLIDGKSRSADVAALEETTLGLLPREMFLCTMKENTAIALDLLNALVKRLRKADDLIESLAFLDVNERLVKYLSEVAKREGQKDKNSFRRIKKLTHREIAARIGASRESVTKLIKGLISSGNIIEENDCFLISPEILSEPDR